MADCTVTPRLLDRAGAEVVLSARTTADAVEEDIAVISTSTRTLAGLTFKEIASGVTLRNAARRSLKSV